MRQFINLVESAAADEPFIDAHRAGDTIVIDMMSVPRNMRGKGGGRRYYEAREAALPADIKYVRAWAADTGDGKSNMFWEAMGFDYQYTSSDGGSYNEDDDIWWWMVKGVNGTATPEPVVVDDDDDEELDESVAEWPQSLKDEYAIADYIEAHASDDVDHGLIVDHFRDMHAVLRKVPLAEIDLGHTDANISNPAKTKRYMKMDPETMPPILIEDGVVVDGNHRYRVAKKLGLTEIWCYVVEEQPIPVRNALSAWS